MRIQFCGAARTTTGSRHLISINGKKILLDCGLYQGRRKEAYHRNREFPFNPKEIHAVILSHAHIDHSGNLPNLVGQGFRGNIYATHATRNLCQVMLADSARIQESDAEYLNRKRKNSHYPTIKPLYSEEMAEKTMRHFVDVGYERELYLCDGARFSFHDAGHILGSAQVVIDFQKDDKKIRLLFSGDVGRGDNTLLRDPAPSENIDVVIMESTYGDRLHEQKTDENLHLARIINDTFKRGGKIIIPSFAVERAQQLIYAFNQLNYEKQIPPIPIYLDSPLAVNATEIFRLHPECFNDEVYKFMHEKQNPFGFETLSLIRKSSDSKKLNSLKQPAVIISASGMCEAGRILHHLKNNIQDPKNTILFVGYCAQNTLGRKIRTGHKLINIFREQYQVKAEIQILDSFSGHADKKELLHYFDNIGGKKNSVFLVHGEEDQSMPFAKILQERQPEKQIHVPTLNQSFEI